jgi:Domain of unknown function (DUF4388)
MSQRRGTTTDNLLNIIQVIQLGRKTGILTTERGEGVTQEDGKLVFVQGQIIEADSGYLVGQQAVNWLKTWGACRFLFVPSTNNNTTNSQEKAQSPVPYSRTAGEISSSFYILSPTEGEVLRSRDTQPLSYTTDSLPAIRSYSAMPQRIQRNDIGIEIINRKKLSRTHLRLFLLVDGQRNILELARLIGKKPDEVQKLLIDLETNGIIQR